MDYEYKYRICTLPTHKSLSPLKMHMSTRGLAPSFGGFRADTVGHRLIFLCTLIIYLAHNVGLALSRISGIWLLTLNVPLILQFLSKLIPNHQNSRKFRLRACKSHTLPLQCSIPSLLLWSTVTMAALLLPPR